MKIASAIQVFGLISLFAGVWMYSIPAALIVSGVALTLVGIAMERPE